MLFDALARSSTSFADVSRHYTGRMNDYIQDLRWPAEGCVRRAHEEEFMDVQLDVGGGIGTIEEALGRFIEPEIMDGDNKVCPLTAQPIACRRGVGVSCTYPSRIGRRRPLFPRPFSTVTERTPGVLVPLSGILASRRRKPRKNEKKRGKNGRDMA